MKKFFFYFASINTLKIIEAFSVFDARAQLMDSPLACYYNQAELLNPND